MRALVVGEHPDPSALLANFLRDEGWDVRVAGPRAEALRAVMAWPADVVAVDGLCPACYAGPCDADRQMLLALGAVVPVVLATGHDWATECRPADLGLEVIVPKPFDLQAVASALAAAVRRAPRRS